MADGVPPSGDLSTGVDAMSASAHRKRANSSLTFETLEVRQLLSANMPAIPASEVRAVAGAGPLDKAPSLFIEPQAGRAPIIGAIDAARSQIRLGICNLSDPQIGDALAAAVARGVNVRVIADHADYMNKPEERAELTTRSDPGPRAGSRVPDAHPGPPAQRPVPVRLEHGPGTHGVNRESVHRHGDGDGNPVGAVGRRTEAASSDESF